MCTNSVVESGNMECFSLMRNLWEIRRLEIVVLVLQMSELIIGGEMRRYEGREK